MGILSQLEAIFGWVYFVAWSATFWPQVLLILKRRTTAGLSTDFMAINITGFASYIIFTFSSYFIPAVSDAYQAATGYPPQVELADVLFAAHGTVMCAVLVALLFIFPPRIPPKPYVSIGSGFTLLFVILGLVLSLAGHISWYKYLSLSGAVKVLASLIKHFPQVFLNRARGSTVGWSYTMVLLDVVGGGFSVAQQVVKAIRMGSAAPFTSNLAKTFLAAESLLFDFWFILQHSVFYPDRTDIDKPNISASKTIYESEAGDVEKDGGEQAPLLH